MWKYIVTIYNKDLSAEVLAITAWTVNAAINKASRRKPSAVKFFAYRLPYWAIIRYAIDKHFYYRPRRTTSRSHGGDS